MLSPDTDAFVLLLDIPANGHLGVGAQLRFNTGKGAYLRTINIMERVCLLGTRKSQGLLGLHNFSDLGGKFVGISLLMLTIQSSILSFVLENVLCYTFILLMKSFSQSLLPKVPVTENPSSPLATLQYYEPRRGNVAPNVDCPSLSLFDANK